MYTVNMDWKYRFSYFGTKVHSKVANLMLILDLKSVFDLVQSFKRILQFKWRPPKVLFSGLFSKSECMISLLVSFSKYGALYQNWSLLKDVSIDKFLLKGTGGHRRYLQFNFSILAKNRKFLVTFLKPELLNPQIKTKVSLRYKNKSYAFILPEKIWYSEEILREISEVKHSPSVCEVTVCLTKKFQAAAIASLPRK